IATERRSCDMSHLKPSDPIPYNPEPRERSASWHGTEHILTRSHADSSRGLPQRSSPIVHYSGAIRVTIGNPLDVGPGLYNPRSKERDMAGISRREFLEKSAIGSGMAGLLAANAARLGATPLGLPIGSQTYPHRQLIADGKLADLLTELKNIGVDQIELC